MIVPNEMVAADEMLGRIGQALEDEEKFGTFARRAITVLAKGGTS